MAIVEPNLPGEAVAYAGFRMLTHETNDLILRGLVRHLHNENYITIEDGHSVYIANDKDVMTAYGIVMAFRAGWRAFHDEMRHQLSELNS